jgi:DNA-binding transcriptional regulator PaaX
MNAWTFVTNHAVVLSYIGLHPLITARDLSLEIGITERAVRRIIAELEGGGYLAKAKEGRRVRYTINHGLPLRHKTQRDKMVGDLLRVLGWRIEPFKKKGRHSRPKP